MAKRLYPHNRVRYWYAYDLDEICVLFADIGLHIQTVRTWVKSGLKTIDNGKPTLIYGSDLIAYIKAQNDKGKCQTLHDQMYCMKCKDARPIYQKKIKANLKNGILQVSGHCRECKTVMYKNYKKDDYAILHRIFNMVDVLELYDCATPSVKTHISEQIKPVPSESIFGEHYGDFFNEQR